MQLPWIPSSVLRTGLLLMVVGLLPARIGRAAGVSPAPLVVRSVPRILKLARYEVDYRRQREVQRALDLLGAERGRVFGLNQENWRSFLADLARKGYLARPGGPPSGKGAYLTDLEGRVYSTAFGSHRTLHSAPRELLHEGGWTAPPEVMLRAIDTGRPEAMEVGLPRLPDEVLDVSWGRLRRALEGFGAPWSVDVVLERVRARPPRIRRRVSRILRPFLRDVMERSGFEQRWLAAGLFHESGQRDLPAFTIAEWDPVLERVASHQLPVDSLYAVLDEDRKRAELFLIARLYKGDDGQLSTLLEALPRYAGRDTVEALADLATRGGVGMRFLGHRLVEVVEDVAGEELGEDPRAWRAWLARTR